MTFEQIKELVELVAQRQLQGLEIERSGFRIKIDGQQRQTVFAAPAAPMQGGQGMAPAQPMAQQAYQQAPQPMQAPAAEAPAAPVAPAAPAGHILNSPIVGTFYRSPSPDNPPFADVGARVKKGQVLCIIEAMKLMNEIESDVDGVVLKVIPQDAQAVEYGEPLFSIQVD